jgi:spore coat polysaccharide biosynthesis protein SpsF
MIKEIALILQARIDSTRLPVKIFLELNNKSILKHIIDRVKQSKYIRNIIVATNEFSFFRISDHLKDYDCKIFCGSNENVLNRYYSCAKQYNSKIIIRACGDNPLVDIEYLDKAIEYHINNNGDLTHYLHLPLGTGVEVINFNILETINKLAKNKYDQEHVTPFLYKHRCSFCILEPQCEPKYFYPEISVTIDTQDDYEKVKMIYDYYKKNDINLEDIINYYRNKNEID